MTVQDAVLALDVGRILGIVVTAWGALAVHFDAAPPHALADTLAVGWTLSALVILLLVRPRRRALAIWATTFAVLLLWWTSLRPRNDRDWSPDVAQIPRGVINGDLLTIHNVRNFEYRSEDDFTPHWEDRTYDLSKLEGTDLFLSYWGSPNIAHTIFSWGFADGQHLAISIETRKERGEQYSAIAGFFKQYELCYIAADERDLIGLRTNYRHEQVYRYPLRGGLEAARGILLDYIRGMNALADHPQFYNALTDNCTTNIRMHAQHIGRMVPWDWRILANGHLDEMLYERGIIDTSAPFAEVRQRSSVNAAAHAAGSDPAFAQRIRAPEPGA